LCKVLQDAGLMPNTEDALERAVRYYAAMDCLLFSAPELARVAASFAATTSKLTVATDNSAADADAVDTSAAMVAETLSNEDKQAVRDTMLRCGMYEVGAQVLLTVAGLFCLEA
jgi:glutaminase